MTVETDIKFCRPLLYLTTTTGTVLIDTVGAIVVIVVVCGISVEGINQVNYYKDIHQREQPICLCPSVCLSVRPFKNLVFRDYINKCYQIWYPYVLLLHTDQVGTRI